MAHTYQRVSLNDDNEGLAVDTSQSPRGIPSSPPPSFRSHSSSPTSRRLLADDPLATEAERTLASTFDTPSDDESSESEDESGADARQRLMRADATGRRSGEGADGHVVSGSEPPIPGQIERRVTQLPVFSPQMPSNARFGGGTMANDGVFANLSAKPTRGEDLDEKPPTYEQAAADATPPYWETTILAPGMVSDEVFVDGLPVGSVFSFIWNGMISMSFQLVGFVLTYLLHTSHAAKNGSLAGLGITLIQFGFQVKGISGGGSGYQQDSGSDDFGGPPPDPNSHDFDPNAVAPDQAVDGGDGSSSAFPPNEWLAYILMIVGWFILIRAVSDYLRAKRHEQLVLQSPDRGLGVAVVAEGEQAESTV